MQIDVALSHVELQVVPVDFVGNEGTAEEWSIDEVAQGAEPVPDYVPDPDTNDVEEYEEPEESESIVEDDTPVAGRNTVINGRYRCKQEWSPIQAVASGFVIGNCSEGTRVSAYRQRTFKNFPGAESEGKIWVAGSFPDGASFKGCGWLGLAKRVESGGAGSGNSLCSTYNRPSKATFMHRAKRRPNVPAPNTQKYPKYFIWATRVKQNGKWVEMDGYRAEVTQACRAYANINPWRKNQTASGASTQYTPGRSVMIRYLSRYRALNPSNGQQEYWIMAHTRQPETSWLWMPASCKFKLVKEAPQG